MWVNYAEPGEAIERQVEHDAMRQAFAVLDEDDRDLLALRLISGLSADEVAKLVGRSASPAGTTGTDQRGTSEFEEITPGSGDGEQPGTGTATGDTIPTTAISSVGGGDQSQADSAGTTVTVQGESDQGATTTTSVPSDNGGGGRDGDSGSSHGGSASSPTTTSAESSG